MLRTGRPAAVLALLALVLVACTSGTPAVDAPTPEAATPGFTRVDGVTTTADYSSEQGLPLWQERAPRAQDVRIPSTVDGAAQPALWQPPPGDGAAPLLVVLHSWSSGYQQHNGIPFAQWAERAGWGMIHPDFRGVNETPQATGSDLAVSDVLDAVDWAAEQASIDPDRVYVIGFSGGGMMSLLMAGRHPDRFAAAAAWGPIDDLVDWYGHNVTEQPDTAYPEQIVASCGGDPLADDPARQECTDRSPATYLDAARDAGVPIYLGHGVADTNVPPRNSVRAFDRLVDAADRLPAGFADAVDEGELPEGPVDTPTYFGAGDPEVLFARTADPVTLVLFDGEHDMVFHPALEWMTRLPE